jgi:hypothetical protein
MVGTKRVVIARNTDRRRTQTSKVCVRLDWYAYFIFHVIPTIGSCLNMIESLSAPGND